MFSAKIPCTEHSVQYPEVYRYIRLKTAFVDAWAILKKYNSEISENIQIVKNAGSGLYTYRTEKVCSSDKNIIVISGLIWHNKKGNVKNKQKIC